MREEDYYSVLGITSGASFEEIRQAYRALARTHHPDTSAGDSERFIAIRKAYDVLKDPRRRGEYDRRGAEPDAEIVDAEEPASSFDAEGTAGYRNSAPPPQRQPPRRPAPDPVYVTATAYQQYRSPPQMRYYRGRPPRPFWRRFGTWFWVVTFSSVAIGAIVFFSTRPAALGCPAPVSGTRLPAPPGNEAIRWQGTVSISTSCYIDVDDATTPSDQTLPDDGSDPSGLLITYQGGSGYQLSFGDESDGEEAVQYIGVATVKTTPSESDCRSMAKNAPDGWITSTGQSACVVTNAGHVVYLKITGMHTDSWHDVSWITADMIVWR
jgi:hypothetical protein